MKINFNKEGLAGDNLKLVEDLEKRMPELPELASKQDLQGAVRSALKGFVNEQGETTVDPALLAELLSDDESKSVKGLRAALIKQGEIITALQEGVQQRAAKDPLREGLNKIMPDIEKRMKAGGNDRTEVSFEIRAAAVMTMGAAIDETTNNIPQDLVESMAMDAFYPKRRGLQYIEDIADKTIQAGLPEYITWLEEGNEQGAFAIVAEGGLKPLVSTSLVRNKSQVRKVAGKYVVTEEFQKFRANAYNIIRTLINDKMRRDKNAIQAADLSAVAVSYTGTDFDHTVVDANYYDVIGAVATQMMNLNFVPDTIVLNPTDLWKIRLAKNANGTYLFPIVTQDGITRVFEFNVIATSLQPVGTAKMLETGLFKILEEPITVRAGYGLTVTTAQVNGTTVVTDVQGDLDTNRFRVIVETFFHDYLATNNIGSVVNFSFTTIQTALEAA